MLRAGVYALLLGFAVACTGCSPETQREAGEAVEQTGESLKSAAEDAANVTEGAVEGAKEAIEDNQSEPDTKPPE